MKSGKGSTYRSNSGTTNASHAPYRNKNAQAMTADMKCPPAPTLASQATPTTSSPSFTTTTQAYNGRENGGTTGVGHECAGCRKRITERFLLKALDSFWHEDCLKCACCDCRLGEVGSTLFTRANLILCKRDYLRMFGTTGYCSACNNIIPAFEMVMRAKGNVYHLECFACQQCSHRFCVGDKFYLMGNRILCEIDYEEQQQEMALFANSNSHYSHPSQMNMAPSQYQNRYMPNPTQNNSQSNAHLNGFHPQSSVYSPFPPSLNSSSQQPSASYSLSQLKKTVEGATADFTPSGADRGPVTASSNGK